jgi:hypothetical protein
MDGFGLEAAQYLGRTLIPPGGVELEASQDQLSQVFRNLRIQNGGALDPASKPLMIKQG